MTSSGERGNNWQVLEVLYATLYVHKIISILAMYVHTYIHVCKIVIFVNTFIFVLVCFLPFVAVVDAIVVVAAVVE